VSTKLCLRVSIQVSKEFQHTLLIEPIVVVFCLSHPVLIVVECLLKGSVDSGNDHRWPG